MSFRFLLSYISFFCLSLGSAAQYYDSGQDPASLKWMQIKTPAFKIIYPESYGENAISFAHALQEASSKLAILFPEKRFTIPIIIHNFTTQSNGYVSWAPRRMEIYPTPEQNSIPLDPFKQLALHELTHVKQLESLRTGFSKAMSVAFGEQFTGVVSALLPLWFLEGSAVYAETRLTGSGRGRSPSFQKQLKALLTEKNAYSYEKMTNGSFRNFIPDHYQTGYQVVAWSYLRYDNDLWNRMLTFTGRYPFTIIPNNISLYSSAKLTRKRVVSETFAGLKKLWEDDLLRSEYKDYEEISPGKRGEYINYYSPLMAGADSVIAIKTSLSNTPSIVLIRPSERSEKRMHTTGYLYPWSITMGKGKIVWVENQSDPRWENRNYSVIKIMDIKTGRVNRLTSRSRYLSAAASPDGKLIAAVENTVANENILVMIDPADGSVMQSIPVPLNTYLQRPQWSADGKILTAISLNGKGEGIMSYSPGNNEWKTLIEPSVNDLQSSFLRNDTLFYISSVSGTDNLYFLTPGKEILALTNSKSGVSDLYISGGKAVFSDYSYSGNAICQTGLNDVFNKAGVIPDSSSFLIRAADSISLTPTVNINTDLTPVPYRKWQHLFKFHSWMPFYADVKQIQADPLAVRPGFTIMSQNHLSTLITTLGYEYSSDLRHKFHSRVTWKGWYPVIESQLDYGDAPYITYVGAANPNPLLPTQGIRFRNTVSLPLSFARGRFVQFLSPYFISDYKNSYVYIRESNHIDYGQMQLSSRLYFSNSHRTALRDIYPKWAQVIDLNYTFSPWDKLIYGPSKSIKSAFFFPGIFSNNSTRLRFEKEIQDWMVYYIGNNIRWPRGYKNIISKDLTFLSIDYTMPLLYPDLNIPGFIYIKRIRGTVFYDLAGAKGNAHFKDTGLDFYTDSYESFRSYGFQLMTDFHLFRNPFMISAGVQGSWPDITGAPFFEFLFNIDIFGMTIGRSGL